MVGGGLEGRYIVHRQKGVVVFVEADAGTPQFTFDEGVTVEPVAGVEGKEAGEADDDRPQHFVANIEVVMGEAAAPGSEETVVGIGGGILGHADAEGAALFHALEDEIDAVAGTLLHTA